MKFLAVSLASLALASAAAVTKKANYDNYKVYRVDVGEDSSKLGSVIDKLQLSTWKGKVGSSKVIDVVVPPARILDFEAGVNGLSTKVLYVLKAHISFRFCASFVCFANLFSNP
jgi:carboxypeptidase A4